MPGITTNRFPVTPLRLVKLLVLNMLEPLQRPRIRKLRVELGSALKALDGLIVLALEGE